MRRSLRLLIAATAIVSAPTAAMAQTWPMAGVAAAPRIAPQSRMAATLEREVYARPQATTKSVRPALKLSSTRTVENVPEVEVTAKDDWSDDEGFRVTPTKLAFKRRF